MISENEDNRNERSNLIKEEIKKAFCDSYLNENYSKTIEIHSNYIDLWKENLSGKIFQHIILFGNIYTILNSMKILRNKTTKPIFIFSNEKPGNIWNIIRNKYDDIYYLEGNFLF